MSPPSDLEYARVEREAERVRLCDENAVERVTVNERQAGRRARDSGTEREFAQLVTLDECGEPVIRRSLERSLMP